MKSVKQQLADYFDRNTGIVASAVLQRTLWTNENGTTAVPRTIVRRLQELENERKIEKVSGYRTAHYRLRTMDTFWEAIPEPKTVRRYVEVEVGGERIMREVLVQI